MPPPSTEIKTRYMIQMRIFKTSPTRTSTNKPCIGHCALYCQSWSDPPEKDFFQHRSHERSDLHAYPVFDKTSPLWAKLLNADVIVDVGLIEKPAGEIARFIMNLNQKKVQKNTCREWAEDIIDQWKEVRWIDEDEADGAKDDLKEAFERLGVEPKPSSGVGDWTRRVLFRKGG